jgi:hypothetical protein
MRAAHIHAMSIATLTAPHLPISTDGVGLFTLGDGKGLCEGLAGDVDLSGVLACWNVLASCLRAISWALPMVIKGAAGAGCNRVCVSSLAAIKSTEDMRGMRMSARKI